MSKVIHGIIILCILMLLYFWIVPWKKKEINFQGVLDQKNTTNVITETADLVSPSVSPERVALLFGWKRKPAARPVTEIPVEEEPPIEEKVVLATFDAYNDGECVRNLKWFFDNIKNEQTWFDSFLQSKYLLPRRCQYSSTMPTLKE